MNQQENLKRELKDRHIQLIAIGGAIGVGLFLGSAKAIQAAGPSLMFSYALAGIIIFFIMRALGELILYKPVSGSFSKYAEEFVGPWAGFFTGWSYWFMWIVTGMAEITAVGQYMTKWFPNLPQWIPALMSLIFVYIINLVAVKLFGEFEFWFALIKVVTIIALLAIGLVIISVGLGNIPATGISNLWSHGGFFPKGIVGMLLTLQMVAFAFQGVELVGVTAGEAENPNKSIPSAINKVLWRIMLFYVGSLFVIMSIYAWNQLDPTQSPFVVTFEKIGIPYAADIINFVVLTAALSSCNSGVFSTGRMLHSLALSKQAPAAFGKLNKRQVPSVGLTVSGAALLIGVILNYLVPEKAFVYVTSTALVGSLWTWGMIVVAHMKYRKAIKEKGLPEVSYKLPGAPITNWIVLLFLALIVVMLGVDQDTRVALYVAPIWFAILTVGYLYTKKRNAVTSTSTEKQAG
ncbi:amino acid permease [Thermoflavimicrobium dichotomicum]|uniref:Amino acid transporter, AAT family/D-serine/D-alanine/glycine transporter n=1 Tax=Thermoflavimicrobium dichotomicum TaxID=46223 RepID=A0A1I3U0H3_9BACL|nr:amino acid permease [Thermoflavimicrobium dichotomicum]SFJ76039.1 amino acid transporter, AAT family/D-serine/D-alanine/glycine transporter [Thermoflavimicrobium dichotomicum]